MRPDGRLSWLDEPMAPLTPEQRAALVAARWPAEPRYRVTQPGDPVRARETWRRAVLAYVYRQREECQ